VAAKDFTKPSQRAKRERKIKQLSMPHPGDPANHADNRERGGGRGNNRDKRRSDNKPGTNTNTVLPTHHVVADLAKTEEGKKYNG